LGGYLSRMPSRRAGYLVYAFIAGGVIIACGGIADYLRQPGRLATVWGEEINLTPLLVIYIPCMWGVAVSSASRLLKTTAGFAGVLLLPLLVWNQSRSAWCAVAVALLCITWLRSKRVFFVLLAGLIVAAWLLLVRYGYRYMHVFNPYSWGNRIDLWKAAVGIFEDFPVFGAGPGMYERLLYVYAPLGSYSEGMNHLHAHSTHLELLAEAGLTGMCAWLFVWARFFGRFAGGRDRSFVSGSERAAFLAGAAGAVLASLVLAGASTIIIIGVRDAALFWILFGAACSYPQKREAML
ncbi:MAG: O-antigen ligase family protein, partial [Candidatus Omnitrophica bacterium]|nr:O-antigen ligase family protein [Candidatus Omnitrophota bacterium]